MSDKELIKQEIEKRLSFLWNLIPEGEKVLKDDFTKEDANNLGKYTELESLLKFIDSFPEESASEDLEKEIEHYLDRIFYEGDGGMCGDFEPQLGGVKYHELAEIARHFAEWQKQKDFEELLKSDMSQFKECYEKGKADAMKEMKEVLQTEYEKGRFDMREEMMKDAVETTIVNDWQYGKDPDHAIIPAIHQRIEGFNVGDKVKIIIIKEEQK